MKRIHTSLLIAAVVLFATGVFAQTIPSYKIANRFHLPGDDSWDYLTMDEASGLLYVSHSDKVQVMDAKTGKITATIPDTKGVHGIAIAREFGRGYISCGRDSSVLVFDLKSSRPLNRIKVHGANPDAILYDPFSKKVFAFNGRTRNVSVIDVTKDKVVADIELTGKPEFAATDEKGKVYVNIEDKSTLCMINSTTLKVEQYWPVAPAEEPSGLAIDNINHRLFTVSDKHLVVLDALSGKVVASLPIGDGVDGVSYDPIVKRIYSANGEGTMTVVQQESADSYKVVENFPTQKGGRTISVDAKTHHIYIPTAEFGKAPEATKEHPHPRRAIKEGSFIILDIVSE